jgi:peroxiredoxin
MAMFRLPCLVLAASLLAPAADQPNLVGAQAPDFSLEGLDGKQVALKSLRGHTVVLYFWATYWESCGAVMGHLEKLNREFKNQDVVLLGINVGQLARVVRAFIKQRGYTFLQLVNARGELILSYQATDAPTVVIIAKDGKIVSHLSEEQDEEVLRSALKKAMQ